MACSWFAWLRGGLVVGTLTLAATGCDSSQQVEIPETPTEKPAESPGSTLPPPPPPQY